MSVSFMLQRIKHSLSCGDYVFYKYFVCIARTFRSSGNLVGEVTEAVWSCRTDGMVIMNVMVTTVLATLTSFLRVIDNWSVLVLCRHEKKNTCF